MLFINTVSLKSQITAQGQGSQTVLWGALGFEQDLGRKFQSTSTIAYSRNSDVGIWNFVERSGVFAVTQDVRWNFSKNWQVSLAGLYAHRNYYEADRPSHNHEFRLYPRVYHRFNTGKLQWQQTFRGEYRRFFGPRFSDWENHYELRARYQIRATMPLDTLKKNSLSLLAEGFFASREGENEQGQRQLQTFRFTEIRTSLFYRRTIADGRFHWDIGVMHQLWQHRGEWTHSVLLQTDFIFVNLFKKNRKR